MSAKLTEKQYLTIQKHIETIKSIVKNQSCSAISIEYRNDLSTIAKALGHNYCTNCQAGVYSMTTMLYSKYIEYENETKGQTNAKRSAKTNKTRH